MFLRDILLSWLLTNVVLVRTLSHNKDGFIRETMERITCMTLYLPHFTNVNVFISIGLLFVCFNPRVCWQSMLECHWAFINDYWIGIVGLSCVLCVFECEAEDPDTYMDLYGLLSVELCHHWPFERLKHHLFMLQQTSV